MAYFLFIDESGRDRKHSPHEVLAGVAIEDRCLWRLIQALRAAEEEVFGRRYTAQRGELKAKRLLKRKTYRLAAQMEEIPTEERAHLARSCLEGGAEAGKPEITALAQAKLAYVRRVFEVAAEFRCRMFASLVSPASPRVEPEQHLRKDYAYLFERFYYFLEDTDPDTMGIIIFDELGASKSIALSEQMHRYFERTGKGRRRASQIVPEPLFVRSELTSGVQIADLLAYILSWGFPFPPHVPVPARPELRPFAAQIAELRHAARRPILGNDDFVIWSFCWIDDLRTQEERQNNDE